MSEDIKDILEDCENLGESIKYFDKAVKSLENAGLECETYQLVLKKRDSLIKNQKIIKGILQNIMDKNHKNGERVKMMGEENEPQ